MGFLLFFFTSPHYLVGSLSLLVWTHGLFGMSYIRIWTCKAQLSMFHMERRSRNIITVMIVVRTIILFICCYYFYYYYYYYRHHYESMLKGKGSNQHHLPQNNPLSFLLFSAFVYVDLDHGQVIFDKSFHCL